MNVIKEQQRINQLEVRFLGAIRLHAAFKASRVRVGWGSGCGCPVRQGRMEDLDLAVDAVIAKIAGISG